MSHYDTSNLAPEEMEAFLDAANMTFHIAPRLASPPSSSSVPSASSESSSTSTTSFAPPTPPTQTQNLQTTLPSFSSIATPGTPSSTGHSCEDHVTSVSSATSGLIPAPMTISFSVDQTYGELIDKIKQLWMRTVTELYYKDSEGDWVQLRNGNDYAEMLNYVVLEDGADVLLEVVLGDMANMSTVGGLMSPPSSSVNSKPMLNTSSIGGTSSVSSSASTVETISNNNDGSSRLGNLQAVTSFSTCSSTGSALSPQTEDGSSRPKFDTSLPLTKEKTGPWIKGQILGKGSYGSVYLGLQQSDGTIMAVKELKLDTFDDKTLQSVRKELLFLQKLKHENIVSMLGTELETQAAPQMSGGLPPPPGAGGKTLYIFLEYAVGGTLSSLLQHRKEDPSSTHPTTKPQTDNTLPAGNVKSKSDNRDTNDGNGQDGNHTADGGLPTKMVQNFTKQILDGLHYLHEQSIVHRDLKCDNILVGTDNTLKLADFGCSSELNTIMGRSTKGCQSLVGTPMYIAPEVVLNESYGTKADVWSLGCIVSEMLTGKQPWPVVDNPYSLLWRIGKDGEMPPNVPQEGLGETAHAFLDVCLVRDPTKRASVEELLQHPFVC
eukprot:TRINITY_DN66868_c2_g1_i1.p1 TRINITY_DN66868_c2_g1~~TRINITY_DN66868_c2_g1_i1.p1  ORF type:complete len:605 (+),score=25.63 TRINITY_DN66868_c2_g1_i1:123-1937(+)